MYIYACKIRRVVDGDTVDVDIDLGFGVWLRNERVRLRGIDTPESRTRDPVEKIYGLASKAKLKELLAEGPVQINTQKDERGKFGRMLGTFFVWGKSINALMVQQHHAVLYHGQAKSDVEAGHLANREALKLHEEPAA